MSPCGPLSGLHMPLLSSQLSLETRAPSLLSSLKCLLSLLRLHPALTPLSLLWATPNTGKHSPLSCPALELRNMQLKIMSQSKRPSSLRRLKSCDIMRWPWIDRLYLPVSVIFCCPSFSLFWFVCELSSEKTVCFFLIIHCPIPNEVKWRIADCFTCFLFCPVPHSFWINYWQWYFSIFTFIYSF